MHFLEWIASASRIRSNFFRSFPERNFQPLQFAAACAPPLLLQALSVFAPVVIMNLQSLRIFTHLSPIRILLRPIYVDEVCMKCDQRGAGVNEEDQMTHTDEMRTREVRVGGERERKQDQLWLCLQPRWIGSIHTKSFFHNHQEDCLHSYQGQIDKQVLFYLANSIWVRKFRASSSFCLFSSSSSRRFASGSYKEFEACAGTLHLLYCQ